MTQAVPEPKSSKSSKPNADASLNDWLAYLESIHSKPIDMGLDRLKVVQQHMNFALKGVVFTVAGTNGKGSTCAMLESILTQAGYKVGMYTSPHLIRFTERARINGAEVTEPELISAFEQVEQARLATGISLTYFEFTTLAVALVFSRLDLDAVILEVGLGGRLDAVNIFDADCAICTSVDIDHQAFLGPDRESIGREKAGIFRAGRPAIVGDPRPPQSVIDHANSIGADLWLFARDTTTAVTSSNGHMAGVACAVQHWLIRHCAEPTSCSMHLLPWLHLNQCETSCRYPRSQFVKDFCWWNGLGVFRCCRVNPPWFWTLDTIPTLLRICAKASTTWDFFPTPIVFSACWPIKMRWKL